MRGIDTNIVIRLLLRDEPGQVERVDALVAAGDLFVPFTVLIETEWVLRAAYKLERKSIAHLLRSLAVIEGVSVPDRSGVLWACERYAKGANFADMIHLCATESGNFLTFDRKLARFAGGDAPCTVDLVA
ncbi:MAG TPA: type II toxin-antitoxin system VapC family toxin [Sphingomicrobium sp.]|nr:type II toxin-antitoxin system VapC family toxin [Sphingomicrobium sp.]